MATGAESPDLPMLDVVTAMPVDDGISAILGLPYEINDQISNHILVLRPGRHGLDIDSLSKLSRTCRTAKRNFQQFLFSNIQFPHRDWTGSEGTRSPNTRFSSFLLSLASRPGLLQYVRSIDFTDLRTVNTQPLPECYHTFVDQYIQGGLIRRSSKGHKNIKKDKTTEGYAAQLTILLLLAQGTLRTVRMTMPERFWIAENRPFSNHGSGKGFLLHKMPYFPLLTQLTLDFPGRRYKEDRLRGSEAIYQRKGDYQLLLTAAPFLKTLILRECGPGINISTIPSQITTLKLHDCYFSVPFAGTSMFPSLKSLNLSFGPSIANQYPGLFDTYFQCQSDQTLLTWPQQQPCDRPVKQIGLERSLPEFFDYPHPWYSFQEDFESARHTLWCLSPPLRANTGGTFRTSSQPFSQPSPPIQSPVEHLEISLGYLPPYPHQTQSPVRSYLSQAEGHFCVRSPPAPIRSGEIMYPPVLGGGCGAAGAGAFANLKKLSVHCCFLMSTKKSWYVNYGWTQCCDIDNLLVYLVSGFSPALESLELFGVDLILEQLIGNFDGFEPPFFPGSSRARPMLGGRTMQVGQRSTGRTRSTRSTHHPSRNSSPFLTFAEAIAATQREASYPGSSNMATSAKSTTANYNTSLSVLVTGVNKEVPIPPLSRLKRVTLYTDDDPWKSRVIRLVQEPYESLFKCGGVQLVLLVRRGWEERRDWELQRLRNDRNFWWKDVKELEDW